MYGMQLQMYKVKSMLFTVTGLTVVLVLVNIMFALIWMWTALLLCIHVCTASTNLICARQRLQCMYGTCSQVSKCSSIHSAWDMFVLLG